MTALRILALIVDHNNCPSPSASRPSSFPHVLLVFVSHESGLITSERDGVFAGDNIADERPIFSSSSQTSCFQFFGKPSLNASQRESENPAAFIRICN